MSIAVFTATLQTIAIGETARVGLAFFPKSERPSLDLLIKVAKIQPDWADFLDPYPHGDYLHDISQAAWKLTQTIVKNVDEMIVIKDGNVTHMNPSAMCDMAEFPNTPWGDMTSGVVKWSDTAFSKIIPTDLGQRETWQGWITGLIGGRIYLPSDKTREILADTVQGGQKQGGQRVPAKERLAKEFEPLTDTELDKLGPATARKYLESKGIGTSDSTAKRALTCERERRKNLTTQS